MASRRTTGRPSRSGGGHLTAGVQNVRIGWVIGLGLWRVHRGRAPWRTARHHR